MGAMLRQMGTQELSLFHKALGLALRPFLMSDPNTSRSRQAFFVATPFTEGIPEGGSVSPARSNEQLFRAADAIQSAGVPVFGYAREGSYFDRQYQYLIHVCDQPSSNYSSAQAAVASCLAATKVAYDTDVARYRDLAATAPGLNFNDWMTRFGFEYNTAYAELKDAQQALAAEEASPMSAVKSRLQSMLAARSPTIPTIGTNMPAVLSDSSNMDQLLTGTKTVSPDKIIYRPLHYLSGYEDVARTWVNGYQDPDSATITASIELKDAHASKWEVLGFPELDLNSSDVASGGQSVPLTENSTAASSQLLTRDSAPSLPLQIQAVPNPVTAKAGPIQASTLDMSGRLDIRAYGVQVFDIFRGLWNIDNIREILPALSDDAPAIVKAPFFKTTRLLFGYGVELTLSLPPTAATSQVTASKKVPLRSEKCSDDATTDISPAQIILSHLPSSIDPPTVEAAVNNSAVRSSPSQGHDRGNEMRKTHGGDEVRNGDEDGERTVVWRISSGDGGSPVLLGALAVLT